jgi:glycosyltransferase involved in cell wall biosynthesis
LLRAAAAAGVLGVLEVGYLPHAELAAELSGVEAGLAFIKPCISKLASSATKVGEYLAAGLPVVATAGIGDTDEVLAEPFKGGKPVGVLVRQLSSAAYEEAAREFQQLLDDPDTPTRCRAAAVAHYDLERIGWARYRLLYRCLLGRCQGPAQGIPAVVFEMGDG